MIDLKLNSPDQHDANILLLYSIFILLSKTRLSCPWLATLLLLLFSCPPSGPSFNDLQALLSVCWHAVLVRTFFISEIVYLVVRACFSLIIFKRFCHPFKPSQLYLTPAFSDTTAARYQSWDYVLFLAFLAYLSSFPLKLRLELLSHLSVLFGIETHFHHLIIEVRNQAYLRKATGD